MDRRKAIKLVGAAGTSLAMPFPFSFFKKHQEMKENSFEVIIIGGSYAGLSAAMALGRSLRKTLIIDSGKPCNRFTPHSHNFLTQDGFTPEQISTTAREQVLKYESIATYEDLAVRGKKLENGFEIETSSGDIFIAKKLVFATGIIDLLPDVKGFAECWGKSVVHCPYCHGYEIRNKKTALIANGERAAHLAPMIKNLTDELTILTSGIMEFEPEVVHKFESHRIGVTEKEIVEIVHTDGQIEAIVFKDGSREAFEAAYAAIPFEQSCGIPETMGCEMTEQGHIDVDFLYKTSQEGIFACGDNSTPFRSVASAVYAGNVVGAMINMELTQAAF